MIFVGLDDTDTLDHPGTNKLAWHLADLLAAEFDCAWITRHQLLQDPRVPCTRMNGCVALRMTPRGERDLSTLWDRIVAEMHAWCPVGSDPGLCLTSHVPPEIIEFGHRCQRELVTQHDARELAHQYGLRLMGLGGTEDGVIGALAAVGLAMTNNDGRVTYLRRDRQNACDIAGPQEIQKLLALGIDEIRNVADGALIQGGSIDLGKRLRPVLRAGRVVLFAEPDSGDNSPCIWRAVRVT